jgi:hypothetical protein
MKTRIFLVLLVILGFISNCLAQTSTTLYTPKGTPLTAYTSMPYMSNAEKDYWADEIAYYYPNATEVNYRSATNNYNCHGFAWHVSEGGSQAWIGLGGYDPDPSVVEDVYWTDLSYIETTEPYASKISYYTGNHSAIKTATQGIYRSKWSYKCLMEHARDYGPAEYQMGNRKYYKLNPGITGSTAGLCVGNQRAFSSDVSISGSTYTWSRATGLLDYVSGSGTTSYTVEANSGSGDAYVGLQITTPSGEVATASNKNFRVGAPANLGWISNEGGEPAYVGYPSSFAVYPYYGDEYNWSVYPDASIYNDDLGFAMISWYSSGSYEVSAYAYNACGSSNPVYYYIDVYEDYLLSPNPASNEVVLTWAGFDKIEDLNQIFEVTITNMSGILQGKYRLSGEKLTIPVYNLKNGTYILTINDGKKKVAKQLIVKH